MIGSPPPPSMPITDDGRYYWAAATERVARPFHYRWLLPRLCGTSWQRWYRVRTISMVGLFPAAFWYGGFGWRGLYVAAFFFGLAVFSFNWKFRVLVDGTAMLFALLAADCMRQGWWPAAIAFAAVGAMTKEPAPVFAAVWAWSPIPLVGLAVVAARHLHRAGGYVIGGENRWILEHPYQAGWRSWKTASPEIWVLPWGIGGLVCLAHLTVPLAAALAVAYAQTLRAHDRVRLYQWAWPAVGLAAANALPLAWLLPVAVLHILYPLSDANGE